MTDVAAGGDRLSLAGESDHHTRQEWEKAAAAVLRKSRRLSDDDADASVWQRLTRTTLDGIDVPPVGTIDDLAGLAPAGMPGAAPFTRGRVLRTDGAWDIRVSVPATDATVANAALLADLENGASSVMIECAADEVGGLATVLEGVLLDLAPVVLDAPAAPLEAAEALVALLKGGAVAPGTNLGVDPIGAGLRGIETDSAVVAQAANLARSAGVLAITVDGTSLHDLGASDAQELGYSLAVGAAYLRILQDAGVGIDEALGLLEFRYAATDEQFSTIAKFRAARRAWSRVAELSGATPEAGGQRQHAVTSRPMMGKYDPWVNMLRGTIAAFAAGVGGADAITVIPFDAPVGVPDAFGRRVARNTSSLLIAESHVAKVTDPAGGAYAVERLTDDLARAGWAEFLRIEEAGGIVAALADGSLRGRVEEVARRRAAEVATRRRPLTGISEFPNLAEELPERPGYPHPREVAAYAAQFEAMRDTPPSQRVFLATMGTVAAHTARATFAGNLFAAGGIAVDTAGPTSGPSELVAAYSGQPVVCLAGPDPAYAEWGVAAAETLRQAGARWVILAGKPGDLPVDDSCALGVDALDFLTRTREKLS